MDKAKAKGIQVHPEYKLGSILDSGENVKIALSDFVPETVQAPASWDFDQNIKPFPVRVWGNDRFGDCEIAARCNYLMRLQRLQTKVTVDITNNDAINIYKQMTGCREPGDQNDVGLSTYGNLSQWKSGWNITKKWPIGGTGTRDYHISAYGRLSPDPQKLRTCMYLFSGCIFGIALPYTAQAQVAQNGTWDVVDPSLRGESAPGSWGGHAVYGIAYDSTGITALTWGLRMKMTQAFMDAYVMEQYSVVDSFDTWYSFPHALNVNKLIQEMKDQGITVQ